MKGKSLGLVGDLVIGVIGSVLGGGLFRRAGPFGQRDHRFAHYGAGCVVVLLYLVAPIKRIW